MSSPAPKLYSGLKPALGYAAYLGTSWTWVIGMLFPALILRDYGLWGFVAFAIPNVVGAAAMGFVLTPERAKGILERHKTACQMFSLVTLMFHVMVLAFFFPRWFGFEAWGVIILSLVACLVGQRLWSTKGMWIASALVWSLSMAMFFKGVNTEGAWTGASWELGHLGKDGLLAFIPASALGFALCPYLDLTFLKARAETEKNTGRWAFSLGFGAVFCAMIFFTVCYGGQLLPFFNVLPAKAPEPALSSIWRCILMAHLPVQVGLTLAWHGTELVLSEPPEKRRLKSWIGALVAAFNFLFIGWVHHNHAGPSHFGMLDTEGCYRSFLLLYGTVLPAYVLLKMIPTRQPVRERFRTVIFICASLLSYPLAWGVFVLHHHWLILPCAGVLTLAFVLVQFGPKAQTNDTAV